MQITQVTFMSWLLKIIGIGFVALAGAGAVLPVLPTTPFLLVAAACFAKSSPSLHQKLLKNKTFGPLIHAWQTSRSIPKKAKIIALTSMVIAAMWSCYWLNDILWRLILLLIMAGPFIFVWRLPISQINNDRIKTLPEQ